MGWAIGMFAEEVAKYSELRGMHRSGGLGYGPLAAISKSYDGNGVRRFDRTHVRHQSSTLCLLF